MKKITNLLIVCSLALAGAAMAQQPTPDAEQSPSKKTEKKAPGAVKPKTPPTPKSETPAAKEPAATNPAATNPAATQPATTKPEKKSPSTKKSEKSAPAATTPAATTSTEQPAPSAAPTDKKQKPTDRTKGMNKKSPAPTTDTTPGTTPAAAATATPATKTTPAAKTTSSPAAATASATPAAAASATTSPAAAKTTATPATTASATPAVGATATPATSASASAAASVSPATGTSPANATAAAAKKPEPAKVEQIKQQHATFRAQPRPDRAPAVTFSAGFRLPGVEQWQGPRYEVYRSYRPERHDQAYYRSRYQRVELIAGGYYYFNNGYWYPAWGYSPREEYYAYDAPIYVGKTAEPPDKVIANVQAVLQEMGYYRGEVDGLLGPLTREALTGYQRDNGMTVTAVIDEPTLESLNMG